MGCLLYEVIKSHKPKDLHSNLIFRVDAVDRQTRMEDDTDTTCL